MKKIMFISHNASLTGAPILLARLISVFKTVSNFEVSILLNQSGEITKRFQELGTTFEWSTNKRETFITFCKKKIFKLVGINILNSVEKNRKQVIDNVNNVDYIFNNTIANALLLRLLPVSNKKIISYIHELKIGCEIDSTETDMKFINEISNIIFVPSNAVKSFLVDRYQFDIRKIKILQYIIPIEDISNTCLTNQMDTPKITSSNLIEVAICGTLDWRKGYDILPFIIKDIVDNHTDMNIQFKWIGADLNSKEYLILQNDLLKLGIIDRISFIIKQNDIQAYLSKSDILLLPSREDAFPLVVLEAAHYGIPCIYFSDAGGIGEFCGTDAGIPINYLNIDSMVNAIVMLASNRIERERLGKNAKVKFFEYTKKSQQLQPLIDFINE